LNLHLDIGRSSGCSPGHATPGPILPPVLLPTLRFFAAPHPAETPTNHPNSIKDHDLRL
jgi:hypothetical protein